MPAVSHPYRLELDIGLQIPEATATGEGLLCDCCTAIGTFQILTRAASVHDDPTWYFGTTFTFCSMECFTFWHSKWLLDPTIVLSTTSDLDDFIARCG